MKLYKAFKQSKQLIDETKFVKVYKLDFNKKIYTIIITKRIANKYTVIHFEEDTVYWEQTPRFWRLAGRRYGDKIPIYKFESLKNLNTIFIIKGNPIGDEGLDNGIFRSFKKYDENTVNCITFKRFKAF